MNQLIENETRLINWSSIYPFDVEIMIQFLEVVFQLIIGVYLRLLVSTTMDCLGAFVFCKWSLVEPLKLHINRLSPNTRTGIYWSAYQEQLSKLWTMLGSINYRGSRDQLEGLKGLAINGFWSLGNRNTTVVACNWTETLSTLKA